MTRQAGCEHNFKHGRSTVRSGTAARRSAPCMDKPAGPMRGLERKPVRGTALSMTGERPRSCGERHILVACMSHAGMDGTSGYRVMAALLAHLGALAAGACAGPLRGCLLLEAGARGVQALLAEAGLQRRIVGRSTPTASAKLPEQGMWDNSHRCKGFMGARMQRVPGLRAEGPGGCLFIQQGAEAR